MATRHKIALADQVLPYTGATADVNLGAYNLTAPQFNFGATGQHPIRTNTSGSGTQIGKSVFVGEGAGSNLVYSTAYGYRSLYNANSGGSQNTAYGHEAGSSITGVYSNSAFFGFNSGKNSTNAVTCAYFGANTGTSVNGGNNTAVGGTCFYGVTASNCVVIGQGSVANGVGTFNSITAIGSSACESAGGLLSGVAIGTASGRFCLNTSDFTFIGSGSGNTSTGCNGSTFLGSNAGRQAVSLTNSFAGGLEAGNTSTGTYNLLLGSYAGSSSTLNYVVALGHQAGIGSNAGYCSFVGFESGVSLLLATNTSLMGSRAGFSAPAMTETNILGSYSGYYATNVAHSFFGGNYSGYEAVNAGYAIFLGEYAGYQDTVSNIEVGTVSAVSTNTFYNAGTGLSIGDIGTISTGNADATIEIMDIINGSAVTASVLYGGYGYAVTDTGYILGGGNDGYFEVTSIDAPYAPVDTYSIGSNAGYGYQGGDEIYVYGYTTATFTVDTIDGIAGLVDSASIDTEGSGYTVTSDYVINGISDDFYVNIDTVGGSGEVTSISYTSGTGTYYTSGIYQLNGGNGDCYISVVAFEGKVTSLSLVMGQEGTGMYVAPDQPTGTNNAGTGFLINIDSVGAGQGAVTGVNITSGGTGYNEISYSTSNTMGSGFGFEIIVDSLAFGTAKTIALVAGGTGYARGGYAGENIVTGIGGNDLAIYITSLTSTSFNGTSIAIGRYAGTGGYTDSIALGHGVINSAVQQANIGNALIIDGIYNSDAQSSTLLSTSKVNIANLNISNLPTSSAGLSAGDLWNDSGTLKII